MAIRLVQTITVGAGGSSTVEFSNIPQDGDDLIVMMKARTDNANTYGNGLNFILNNDTGNNYSHQYVRVINGSTVQAQTQSGIASFAFEPAGNTATAGNFGNAKLYLSNYTSSNPLKYFSVELAAETKHQTNGILAIKSGTYTSNSAISNISFSYSGQTILEGSTFSLYIVKSNLPAAKATGGNIVYNDGYYYHLFRASGGFTPTEAITADILIVGGGGGGGSGNGTSGGGGGGGAGAVKLFTNQSLTTAVCAVGIGAGGAGDSNGNGSSFDGPSYLTAGRGGGGAGTGTTGAPGEDGSSGGGGSGISGKTTGWAGDPPGNDGGNGDASDGGGGGGGAGGDGSIGTASAGGAGGAGTSSFSSMLAAVGIGVYSNTYGTYYIGGGGGGAPDSTTEGAGGGGIGGGGDSSRTSGIVGGAGLANTGSGGGGTYNATGGSGGSGLVIVRYAV